MANQFIWFPRKSHHGYFDKALNRHFYSKSEKRDYLNAHGLAEDGSMESQKHRDKRVYEQAMEDRKKHGKPTESCDNFFKDIHR
jgi:hypothetical protein